MSLKDIWNSQLEIIFDLENYDVIIFLKVGFLGLGFF